MSGTNSRTTCAMLASAWLYHASRRSTREPRHKRTRPATRINFLLDDLAGLGLLRRGLLVDLGDVADEGVFEEQPRVDQVHHVVHAANSPVKSTTVARLRERSVCERGREVCGREAEISLVDISTEFIESYMLCSKVERSMLESREI